MVQRKTERLTPLELEIMKVLWETGAANVQTVQQRLERELAYTTVQTMLNILHRKGKVKRALKDRAYFYKPAVSRSQVVKQSVNDLVEHLFGGSVENLVMSLVETKHLTPEKLTRLNKLLMESEEESDADNYPTAVDLFVERLLADGLDHGSRRPVRMVAARDNVPLSPPALGDCFSLLFWSASSYLLISLRRRLFL